MPLIGQVSFATGRFSTVDLPDAVLASLRGYVGSIAGNKITGQVAISSPRGHVAHILESKSGQLVETRHMADVCGVARRDTSFCFSTGGGLIGERASELGWDNHIGAKSI